jgi:hypothetical protein
MEMVEGLVSSLEFTAPLGASVRQQAEQFSQQHANPQKAHQVYLNTLAVSAVDFYLRCMGIEADWSTSQSWNPVLQALMDVADLTLPGLGQVECRPVLPGDLVMQVPLEVCADRIGYIAVRLEPSFRSATLLGFTPSVGVDDVPIQHLRSLDEFLSYLRQLQPEKSWTKLSQWLQGTVETGWRSLDQLIGTTQPLALSFRSDLRANEATVQQAKLLDLGLQLGQESVVLLVAITQEAEQKIGISIQVHPVPGTPYLPADLRLCLQLETGEALQEVRSRSQDNYIKLKHFRGLPGERFEIQMTLGDVKMTESFWM